MAMQKIPTVEQSLLCTSIYINNYKRVIEELVYNSLDAAASSIAIRVCIQENFIQVLDNGNGILKDNFSLLGQKYATSKYVDIRTLKSAPDKYGYKGMSLASIIDVSRNVQIISQCGKSDTTWMKTFANGIEKEVCKTISRPSNGTTVEIKGFLYNLNIQRRSIEPQNELLNIKTSLQQLSLVHCNVSISLRDDCKNEIILQIHKNRTIHDTLQSVFKISEKYFQELQVEKNEYKVKAFINKHNLETNNDYQYIYINGKYIHKSVLHRTLNESLSHFISTGSNRRKYKRISEVKNNCFNRTVPFYFVFITCPNYDFDVTYNSEKTLVEFKDWNEINKLIDKLIKFYNGGLVSKKRDLNEVGNEEKKSNLKTEVKKIMNCILNNKSKQTRISQLQNGIKGKIRKRSRKKKKAISGVKLTNKNNETYDPCQKKDYPDSPNVEQSKDQPEKQEFKLKISKNTQVINYAIKVSNQQVQKIEKPPITFQKNKDLLIKQFDDPTKTVRKRCKYLNRRVLKLLDKNVFKEYSVFKNAVYSFINNETQYRTIKGNTRNLSLCRIANKELKEGNKIKTKNLNDFTIKKSRDLIKPVNTSQYKLIEKKNTLMTHCRQPYDSKNDSFTETLIPMETYNSHNINFEAVKKISCFMGETSRNNIFSTSIKSKNYILNKHSQELYYTIEMTDNHEITNFGNGLKTVDSNLPQEDNYGDLLYFRNTYTIKDFMKSAHNNNKNITYSLQAFSPSRSGFCLEEIEPSIMSESIENKNNNCKPGNYIVQESESDNAEHIIEPINCCETILRSCNNELQDFENEFENSFFQLRDDTLCNYNLFENKNKHNDGNFYINNNVQRTPSFFKSNVGLNICHSKNKISNENVNKKNFKKEGVPCPTNTNIPCQDPLPFTIDNNEIDSDVNYNFQLKSRRTFMPKGMSPIAKNHCKLQNVYEFNDGEVYYEDTIYKHFVKNVLINTEIFEPEVQNIKNLFLKRIEKINSDIQDQDADLIFDSLSLTEAKILGQIDRKFIASIINARSAKTNKSSNYLVLFDQHAVDERVRLESNLSDYIQDSGWKSIHIDPVTIVLCKDDYVYCVNHKEKLARFGLQWTFSSECEMLLNAIPNAILGKNPRQVEIVMKAVKKLISEQIQAIKSLRGNVSLYPKSIMELVFSEACKYAIKFGDKLSNSECANMISSLAGCKTPFQCAHGRPAIAVLMELRNNYNQSYKDKS
ncbi:jg11104 [Pararge aegeria aegeria]|uniref:Jg11104 protein n=1 Tax=Pararge aegeria aegeria TaxID=348720 RepID=A0A8S4SLC0_9NEOP|nr:jg11104 [Pararge aegeria aegeria]